jgi:hypothetical protein
MTQTEALKLALEALEKTQSALARCIGPHKSEEGDRHRALAYSRTTITAIKAALEKKDEPVTKAIEEQAYESGYSTGFMDGAIKAQQSKDGCQCHACKVAPHASDCAVHSEPAYPAGDCNCGASGKPIAWRWGAPKLKNGTFEWRYSLNKTRPDSTPLYAAPQKQPPVIDKSVARRIATQLGWEPPRTPLPDEEIERIYHRYGGEMINCAKAIERAHGIKGEA